MRGFFCRFGHDERGATAIEYGLIVALIGLVLVTALTAFSDTFKAMVETLLEKLGG